MKNLRVELTAGGKSLTEVKIQREIFQGDTLSSLLFAIAMMLLSCIFRKCIGGYKLHRSQGLLCPGVVAPDRVLSIGQKRRCWVDVETRVGHST